MIFERPKSYNFGVYESGLSNVTIVTESSFANSLAMTAVTRCTPPIEKMESVKKQIFLILIAKIQIKIDCSKFFS